MTYFLTRIQIGSRADKHVHTQTKQIHQTDIYITNLDTCVCIYTNQADRLPYTKQANINTHRLYMYAKKTDKIYIYTQNKVKTQTCMHIQKNKKIKYRYTLYVYTQNLSHT